MPAKTVSIIVNAEDEANLAAVAERYPLVAHHRLAQAAYRYGLRSCVRCPDLVVEEARLADGRRSKPGRPSAAARTVPLPFGTTTEAGTNSATTKAE